MFHGGGGGVVKGMIAVLGCFEIVELGFVVSVVHLVLSEYMDLVGEQ